MARGRIVKAPEFRYLRPESVDEALHALMKDADVIKVLAGGQSLLPVLNMRLAEPEILLDISHIDELRGAATDADGRRRYGACLVHADFEDGQVPDATGGLLRTTAGGIGYRAIRNRGTIGGSLAHADPSAEWPVVMAALDASVFTRSAGSQRAVACSELFEGFFSTALHEDEIITEVLVPALPESASWGFRKFTRKAGEFAESIAVAVVTGDRREVREARVWLGGAGSTPICLTAVEQALASGSNLAERDVLALVATDLADTGAVTQDEYRVHLHGVTAWRAITDALAGRASSNGPAGV